MENKEFELRSYRKGDEEALVELFNDVFGRNRTLDQWRWKYEGNPHGFRITVAENAQGKIIGQQCHQLKRVLYKGKEYPFFDTVDLCIKEDYTGQGFAKRAMAFFPEPPFLSYSFPNENSTPAYRKFLDAGIFDEIGVYDKRLNRGQEQDDSSALEVVEFAEDEGDEIDDLWNRKKPELGTCVVRDWEFVKWRNIDCPSGMRSFLIRDKDETVGYFSIQDKNDKCHITDILLLNDHVNTDVLNGIERICHDSSPNSEVSIMVKDPFLEKLLMDSGYKQIRTNKLLSLNGIEKDEPITPYITSADSDSLY